MQVGVTFFRWGLASLLTSFLILTQKLSFSFINTFELLKEKTTDIIITKDVSSVKSMENYFQVNNLTYPQTC